MSDLEKLSKDELVALFRLLGRFYHTEETATEDVLTVKRLVGNTHALRLAVE